MANNDSILLDGIIEQRAEEAYPSPEKGEVFEFFALEQLLKDFDLSREDIESGWVDGRNDGGIDGAFVFVNGHLLQDPEAFAWPKKHAEIEVWLITSKHHDTFQQATVDALLATLPELLDFRLSADQLRGAYSEALLKARSVLYTAYRKLSAARPVLTFRFAYASRGDSTSVGESVRARAAQVVATTEKLFSSCKSEFLFTGASELIALYRRVKAFSLDLPCLDAFAHGDSGYVALVRLEDYARFVTDEQGQLRRYLFDSNVRDYLGTSNVNEDIAVTLKTDADPDFWCLNNGITILATSATAVGRTLRLQDIQIVNGLQTTETIFRHFSSGETSSSSRAVLAKVVVSRDASVRDCIIRATNNQNAVALASLHATDKIQRDIEDILERHEWYYERRTNHFRNLGKPANRCVTPMYVAAGYVSLMMKNPALAARIKPRFMRHEPSYATVFSDRNSIQIWPRIVGTLKRVEDGLFKARSLRGLAGEGFLARWRNLLALLAVSRALGRFDYSQAELAAFNPNSIPVDLVVELWREISSVFPGDIAPRRFKKVPFVVECCRIVAQKHAVAGVECVGRRGLPVPPVRTLPVEPLEPEFVARVNSVLPEQPWRPGIHHKVAADLGYDPALVQGAMQELIRTGRRYHQRDGVVYDASGKVIARDPRRPEAAE